MKSGMRALETFVVVLSAMVLTAALTALFTVLRDRRRLALLPPPASPTIIADTISEATNPDGMVHSPDGDLTWSRNEIQALRQHIGNRTIIVLLELLREREGAPVNYRELMEQTGRTMPQVRADLASFSRAVKKIDGHVQWPISTVGPTDAQSKIAYTIPQPYLEWWFVA